jgi:hypothetical protein
LTTDEGKGILSKVVSSIIEPIADALGFGEEEKKKAKVTAVVTAGSNTDESDDAAENKINIADKNAGGAQDPDALADALSTADEAAIAGSTLKEDGTYDISSWYTADDLEATDGPTTPEIPTDRFFLGDEIANGLPMLDTKKPDSMRFRDNRIDEPPTIAMPEEPTVPSLTEPDTRPMRTNLMQNKTRAMVNASRPDIELEAGPAKPYNVTTAVDDLRQTIADLSYDESRATAMSSLSGFGEDASSQAIRSYLEKAMNNVDSIVQGTDTPTTTPTTTTAPAPSGGDGDDGGPDFPSVATPEQISQAQEQATSSAIESGATQEEAEKAGTVAGGQMAGKGYVGGYGFNKGG